MPLLACPHIFTVQNREEQIKLTCSLTIYLSFTHFEDNCLIFGTLGEYQSYSRFPPLPTPHQFAPCPCWSPAKLSWRGEALYTRRGECPSLQRYRGHRADHSSPDQHFQGRPFPSLFLQSQGRTCSIQASLENSAAKTSL